jgi:nucleoside-diphosphate-sugar epimerase
MNALVTGGTGFVGRHLIDALLERGDLVTALVRSPGKAADLRDRGVRLVEGDLDDRAALKSAVGSQDVIFHVAGLVAARSEADFMAVNRDGAANLATAAEGPRARIVLVSSMAAGGPTARGTRLRGEEPPRPVTAYGRSKLAGEQAIRAGKAPWTIIRPPAVYGPLDTELLRLFKAARLGLAPVFGDGAQELSLVYGPDLAAALVAASVSNATLGSVYYACHPDVVTSADLVKTIGRSIGVEPRVISLPRWTAGPALALTSALARIRGRATLLTRDKANEFFAPAWTGDPGPLEAASGWTAAHDLTAGAALTAAWYRSQGWV